MLKLMLFSETIKQGCSNVLQMLILSSWCVAWLTDYDILDALAEKAVFPLLFKKKTFCVLMEMYLKRL